MDQNLQNQKVVSDSFPWIWYTEPKTSFPKFLKSPGLHLYEKFWPGKKGHPPS